MPPTQIHTYMCIHAPHLVELPLPLTPNPDVYVCATPGRAARAPSRSAWSPCSPAARSRRSARVRVRARGRVGVRVGAARRSRRSARVRVRARGRVGVRVGARVRALARVGAGVGVRVGVGVGVSFCLQPPRHLALARAHRAGEAAVLGDELARLGEDNQVTCGQLGIPILRYSAMSSRAWLGLGLGFGLVG